MINGMTVIDADGHIRERDDDLQKYLGPEHAHRWRPFYPLDNWDRYFGGKRGKMVYDAPTRLTDMDTEGIDVQVLYPTNGLSIGLVREPRWAADLCRAYNDFLAEVCRQTPRLKGVALLPAQNPREALKEVERALGLGLVGVLFTCHGHGKNLGKEEFFPIYEACQALNLPVTFHANSYGTIGTERFDTFLCTHAVAFPFEIMIQLTAVVMEGIPELFPRLKLAFLEAGCGWIPFWMDRLDGEYEKRAPEAPRLKAKPSDYMKCGRIFYSCDSDEETIPYVLEKIGDDILLYASDYPHWDMHFPHSVSDLVKQPIPDASKKKIFHDNPKRLYTL
ncbi:MAG: amidohydrolase [Deltaproteobacteria bacterium]|nr:amidohydrolase [Deltaproteobacteria bacterium]MBI3075566.1 amidohydrolase [Deltaproteobacteria bacterium]